jgi:hypothetical protein
MPIIKVNDQQFALQAGSTRLGGGAVDIRVGDDALGVQAIVDLGADGRAVVRRADANASVRVNGVALGVEPTPLLHGDKVEIGGQEAFFADDTKGGATQFVSAGDVAAIMQKRAGAARATTASGGRLVSLVDGKEYPVPDGGVTIGRDASCGIVVAQTEVSRKHAEIVPAETGYLVHDRSTNGLFVNGNKVEGSQLLARADIIRIGTEEFRFYADLAPIAKPVAAPAAAPAAPASPTPPMPAAAVPPPAPPAPAPVPPSPPPKAPAPPAAAPKPAAPKPRSTTPPPPPPPESTGKLPVWLIVVVALAVVGTVVYLVVLR